MKSEDHMRLQLIKETNSEVAYIISNCKSKDDGYLLLKIALAILVRLRRFLRAIGSKQEMRQFLRRELVCLKKLRTDIRNKIIELIVDIMTIH